MEHVEDKRRVARPHRLRAAAGEIDRHFVTSNDQLCVDAYRRVGNPVIVDAVFEFVSAIRNASDHRAHAGLGSYRAIARARFETLFAELRRRGVPHCRADLQRGELRLQISPKDLRLTDILQDNGANRLVELASLEQLHRRDAQAFLKDLDRARAIAARRGSAHIEMVAHRADESDAPPVKENCLERDDVGKMLAATVGVVGDDDIVGTPSVRRNVPSKDLGEKIAHGVEMDRDTGCLRDIPTIAIKDRGGVVKQLPHDGGAARAPDRDVHLGRRSGQRIVDDLEFDRWDIERARLHLCSPRHEVAALVAMAIPTFEQQHGGVCLLYDGRPLDRSAERNFVASSIPRPRANRRRARSFVFRMICRGPRNSSGFARGIGRRPIAATRSETISTGEPGLA